MGPHRTMAIAPTALGALLTPAARARTAGAIHWGVAKRAVDEGNGEVVIAMAECPSGRLKLSYPLQRSWQPTMAYIVNDVPARRVCVNGKHNGWPMGTHVHNYVPRSGGETAAPLPAFPPVPIGIPLTSGQMRGIFSAFAELCSVDVTPEWWTDPPGLEVK